MKIGILEWICGGGLQGMAATPSADSLLSEGGAMLKAVAQDFLSCGYDVSASIDSSLVEKLQLFGSESRFRVDSRTELTNSLPSSWWKVAADADAVIVIAPEFSNILQTAIAKLAPVCKLLLNCQGDFLEASCDKWLSAQRLDAAQIHHPATQQVMHLTENWLLQHRNVSGKWIIKPRDGAGCEAIELIRDKSVYEMVSTNRSSVADLRMIIQPMHQGAAFSRSAIVDSTGRAHWLPLVTQELIFTDSIAYGGGRVLAVSDSHYVDNVSGNRYSIDRLDEVLNATVKALGVGARGWIGVDLLYSDELDDWLVIEVNPRLTTSFTGLSLSYGPGLMEQMLRAGQGREVKLEPNWKSLAFDSAGHLL